MASHQEQFIVHGDLPFAEGRLTRESDGIFRPHLHQSFCIGGVIAGGVLFRILDEEFALSPGTLVLINPETLHSCNAQQEKRSYYMLYLQPEWCLKIQQSLWRNRRLLPVDCFAVTDPLLFSLFTQTMESLAASCHLMEKEQQLVQLTETIFARCCSPLVPELQESSHASELKQWLGEKLQKDVTLDQYASQKNINPYTLLNHFRIRYGITPHAYRMNCRIEHGRKLLREGEDIGDVALACGFFDQSHFHRYFKQMTTVTPREYQRSCTTR